MNQRADSQGVFTDLASLAALRTQVSNRSRHPNQRSAGSLPGENASRERGAGKTFEEIRPYLAGDDIRHIDWRVTARSGKPQLRVYAADRELPVNIVADQRSAMFFGSQHAFKSVTCARCAAILAWRTVEFGEPVGGHVITNARVLGQSARRSARGALRFLKILNEANQQCNAARQSISLSEALNRATVRLRSGARLAVISDWQDFDAQCAAILKRIARHRAITLVQVSEPLERNMPVSGMLGISNGIERFKLHASRAFQKHYLNQLEQTQQSFEAAARMPGVRLIKVSTADSTDQLINRLMINE